MKPTFKDNPQISQWHQDLYGSAVVSRNRWLVMGLVALVLATLEAIALICLTPLKTVEPYVIQVDANAGITNVIKSLAEKPLTENEAVTKFFVVKYVVARETYDPQDLNHNYDQVRLMSTVDQANGFDDYIRSPSGPLEQFKNTITRTIRISSVSFLNKNTAQVRFAATQRQLGNNEKQESYWIATLSFRFVNSPMEEDERLNNPLGFQIKSYRVDQEVVP